MRMRVRFQASISGLRIRCCCELWCRSQIWLWPHVCWWLWWSSDLTLSLGTSIGHGCSPKKTKKRKKKKKRKKEREKRRRGRGIISDVGKGEQLSSLAISVGIQIETSISSLTPWIWSQTRGLNESYRFWLQQPTRVNESHRTGKKERRAPDSWCG